MYEYTIIHDLTSIEVSKLIKLLPIDRSRYIEVAYEDILRQPFFDDVNNRAYIGIIKSAETARILEERDIAVLGYESTNNARLDTLYVIEDLDALEMRDLDIVYARFHNLPLTILETDRCILREHTLDDYEDICKLYQDDDMTAYMEPLYDKDEEIEYLNNYINYCYKFYGYGLWLIIDKVTRQVIGRAGVELRESCADTTQLELSYQVGSNYQNKGIATEVCLAVIDYAFNILNKESIIARVDRDNIKSIRVLNKLGFTPYNSGVYIRYKG